MTGYGRDYQPRSGDGSIAAEDDSLLREPHDDVIDDPDLEQLPGYNPNPETLEGDLPDEEQDVDDIE
ncbi:hypothetical protein AB0M47_42190 [Hamadaea sp. NPDC051192]|uniref:hypothetical protein n=1 Tax=Hamadaea sp. NPDC051192 TaxID=3154940 RepID=UPI0034301857